MIKRLLLILFALSMSSFAQSRHEDGELKGFTKSPSEHIISRIDEPIVVAAVSGRILISGSDRAVEGVTFEIRGPSNSDRIRAASTNAEGLFIIRRVPEGTYVFKATKNGFQSVVGKLVISKKAENHNKKITLEMPLGV